MLSDSYSWLTFLNSVVLTPITYFCRILLVTIVLSILRRLYVAGKKKGRVTIVVLGDIGRSPRMQYHALSLASHGFITDIVGYADSKPKQEILSDANIFLHGLLKTAISEKFPRIFAYAIKFIMQTVILSWKLLINIPASEYVLMQNPPCIPAMLVCWMVSIFNGSKLVIDWHNYGYTILGLAMGKNHMLVNIAHVYEKIFGQLSKHDICVTKAMQKDLEDNWSIHPVVLYDRPFENFMPLNDEEQHDLFNRLKVEYPIFRGDDEESNFRTEYCDGVVKERKSRPAFIISSTSWTEDEDFSILLNALKQYDAARSEKEMENLPDVICAITGKGPLKQHYISLIEKHTWNHVHIVTPWLSPEDYPKLIGSADLGVCLHTSSSGLDLPMKVVDMFGCGVPVLAIGFNCLDELVQHGVNGLVFQNESDLYNSLLKTLTGFPIKRDLLMAMRKNLEVFRKSSWKSNWDKTVLPLFKS